MKRLVFAAVVAGAFAGIFLAQDPWGAGVLQAQAPRGGPPPEAFAACNGAGRGEACAMRTPRGRLEGTCLVPPGQGRLACVPEGGPPRHGGAVAGGGERRLRAHRVVQSDGDPALYPATAWPRDRSEASVTVEGGWRVIRANGIPNHQTGVFPNSGNPNRIAAQETLVRLPLNPEIAPRPLVVGPGPFGWALNGVPFEPVAAEYYLGRPASGWRYEALSGAVPLGLDANHAHVQPSGAYHYHGLPTQLLETFDIPSDRHAPLVGWAADGFPIYALSGYADPNNAGSPVIEMTSSYRRKVGRRPGGGENPGGYYDGTFVNDYEYSPGSGTLDACNGRTTVTPEFPAGTYAYFLTRDWPVIPRCFRAAPVSGFRR